MSQENANNNWFSGFKGWAGESAKLLKNLATICTTVGILGGLALKGFDIYLEKSEKRSIAYTSEAILVLQEDINKKNTEQDLKIQENKNLSLKNNKDINTTKIDWIKKQSYKVRNSKEDVKIIDIENAISYYHNLDKANIETRLLIQLERDYAILNRYYTQEYDEDLKLSK